MNRLSPADIEAYREQGYVTPREPLPPELFARMKAGVQRLLDDNPDVRPEQLVGAHVKTAGGTTSGVRGNDILLECAQDPYLLDLVEGVLGPDIIHWGSQVFCKPPQDGMAIPWHQDGQYWPMRPLASVTVWVAIDPATTENGCLRVIPGSHLRGLIEHGVSHEEALALNQGISDGIDESAAHDVILDAGQVSLHHVNIIHGSKPNHSGKRRAGWAIRYMPATSLFDRSIPPIHLTDKQVVDYSSRPIWLVRGQDHAGNDFRAGHA
jgi:hypothetical protein